MHFPKIMLIGKVENVRLVFFEALIARRFLQISNGLSR
jgi:hypothetical protein